MFERLLKALFFTWPISALAFTYWFFIVALFFRIKHRGHYEECVTSYHGHRFNGKRLREEYRESESKRDHFLGISYKVIAILTFLILVFTID